MKQMLCDEWACFQINLSPRVLGHPSRLNGAMKNRGCSLLRVVSALQNAIGDRLADIRPALYLGRVAGGGGRPASCGAGAVRELCDVCVRLPHGRLEL